MVHAVVSRPARVVAPSRPYDHVYDPVYTASSAVNHQRALQRTLTNSIHRVPNWQNLFSEVGTFPSCQYRFDCRQRQPQIQFSEFLRATPSHQNVNAGGKERYLFFNRPLIAFMQSATTGLVLSPHAANAAEEAPAEPKTRTVATQSVYREESSQTVPYAPDYVYADKDNPPDIFYLKDWLPADLTRISLHEIEQIEREQARRAFQANIPPAKTDSDFRHRMKLLQERELQDYKYHENDIVELEKKRLAAIMTAVEEREAQFQRQLAERMEKIRAENESNRATVLDKLQRRRYNAMRKVNMKRMSIKHEIIHPPGRDIIEEYSNHGSKVYAPLDREGKVPVMPINEILQKQIGSMGKTYQSVVSLETSIPAKCLTFNVHKPAKVVTSLMRTRKGQGVIQDIDKINDIIQSMKSNATAQNESVSPATELYAKPGSIVRPPTPITKNVDVERNADIDAACILLQRLLRGRAMQSEMERGLRDSISLIDELMSPLVEQDAAPLSVDDIGNYMVDYIIGLTISKSSALLRNDVIAHEELTKLQSLVDRASLERTRREAVQTGLRQKQFVARGKLGQQLKEVDKILHITASTLVRDIKRQVLENASKAQSSKVGGPVTSLLQNDTSLEDADIVLSCLQSQILPEVNTRVELREEQLSAAARTHAVHESILSMLK